MLEITLCSLITVLPDYLLRRHFQGKRWGDQINFSRSGTSCAGGSQCARCSPSA